jgi:autotransporter-associated beta strand protein
MANFVVLSTASGLNTDTNNLSFDANSGFQLGAATDPIAFMAGANWISAYAPKIGVSGNTTMTIQGVISDISGQAGALQKDGAGKLILTGANTYTGNTFVANGTLEGNAASVRGNILIGTTDTNNLGYTNTTALILNQASDATFSGSIAGKGTLEKSGAGVLTLTGALTYTNTTTVSGGSLVVTNASWVASITTNTVAVSGLTSTTAGTVDLLPGPLANLGSYGTPIVAGLAATQSASLINSPNLKLVIVGTAGSTFTGLGYIAGSENELGANGLKNLMNYALGGTGPSSTPAAPVFSISGTTLTLTGNIRNDDTSLNFQGIVGGKVVGQWAYDLNGPWTNVDLTDTGASSTVANTTVKSFSQTVESGRPKKFMRFQVSQ